MKFISLDIETTGLDKENFQVLEIGAILEDTKKVTSYDGAPKFHCIIPHENILGSPFAINLNKELIELISQYLSIRGGWEEKAAFAKINNITPLAEVFSSFTSWLRSLEVEFPINVAGKNLAKFDLPFLENTIPNWDNDFLFKRRYIDPGTLYVDWKEDETVPSLDECLIRAGIEKTVSHNAVEDAWDVICVLRNKYK